VNCLTNGADASWPRQGASFSKENAVNDTHFGTKPGSLLAATLLTLSMQFPAAAQEMMEDMVATGAGDLTVHPVHHASMMLTWNGMNILVDPAPRPGGGGEGDVTAEYTAMPAPDAILVTHEHGDHFNVDILKAVSGDDVPIVVPQAVADKMPDDLKGKAVVMANGDTRTVAGFEIEAVPAYNLTEERLKYHPQGRDNGYVLTLGDTRVYIAGDTEDTPEMRALEDIDAAFVPMNLPYTMDIGQAASAVKEFQPGIVYPYHYGDSDVDAFREMVADASDVRLLKWY
jgi:L-ascorbate metabolism protein UlaG (beta-lactamase superfamily)